MMSLILLVPILVAGGVLLWKYLPSDPPTTDPGAEGAKYVGISTETMLPLSSNDRNNVFWTSESGSGGVSTSTAPVNFPSLLRLGNGFAAPDKDSIVLLDKEIREANTFPVPGLGTGTQSTSGSSPNHEYGAFAFNKGNSEFPDARMVVAVDREGVRSVDRDYEVSALTACDSGEIKWIEFIPEDNEAIGDKGKATKVTWSRGGEIATSDIRWEFHKRIGHESQLSCDSSPSVIISEDDSGNPVSLVLQDRGAETEVERVVELPRIQPSAMARFSKVIDNTLYSLDRENVLSAVDLKEGKLIYSHQLDVQGPSPVSITFEGGRAFVVVRPDQFNNKQAVLPVDLKNPQRTGEMVPLAGYDEMSQKTKLTRMGDSFRIATTVLPKEVDGARDLDP